MLYFFSILITFILGIYLTLIVVKYFNKNEKIVLINKIKSMEEEFKKYEQVLDKLDNQNVEMKKIINKNSNLINLYNEKKKNYKNVKKNIYKKYVSKIRPFDQRLN